MALRIVVLAASAGAGLLLTGCGSGEGGGTTPAPSEIPELVVPHCSEGWGTASPYYVTNADNMVVPEDATETKVCWSDVGIVIATNNTDQDIWQTCEECGCDNYNQGDVAECFLAPVSSLEKSPAWYLEMDVGAKTGAFWGGVVHNDNGTDDLYAPQSDCNVTAPAGSFKSCEMNCSGLLPTVAVDSGLGWWSRTMTVPWGLYKPKFTPSGSADGQPWESWRGNFYRYSYPYKFDNGTFNHEKFQLSGWSSTHNPSFHVPDRFGKITFQKNVSLITSLV